MITLARTFEHEQLELFRDPATGLTGAIAIHSTALGPSMGGLRIRRYEDVVHGFIRWAGVVERARELHQWLAEQARTALA